MFDWLKPRRQALPPVPTVPVGLFSTHTDDDMRQGQRRARQRERVDSALASLPRPGLILARGDRPVDTFDSDNFEDGIKGSIFNGWAGVPETQAAWYAQQTFIGYQMCAMLAQHWLIGKACSMPSKDAFRKGYKLTINNGDDIDPKILDFIRKADKMKFGINRQLSSFVKFGRIFGIRVAKFVVDSPDPDYYKKPFNIDGIRPYSYKGIAQIDPYWVTPELVSVEALEPGSIHFYEPSFWRVNGQTIHRSHLVIYIPDEVPDVLKPAYFYGGISLPQKIFERVYAAERTANEAPMLAMTKRTTVLNTNLEEALKDQSKFDERMEWWIATRDNYQVKLNGEGETVQQFDTSLSELDNIIMTQFQLVASIAEVPGTKLLGTQPKGFNSTGEFEESSYHEALETIQTDAGDPLLDRHYQLLMKSHVEPYFGVKIKNIEPIWNKLDAMTEQESAAVQLTKAQIGAVHIASGVIDASAELQRIIDDPESGYNGLTMADLPVMPDMSDPENGDGDVMKQEMASGAPKPRAIPAPKEAGS